MLSLLIEVPGAFVSRIMSEAKVAEAAANGKLPDGITEAFLNESKDRPAIIAIVIVAVLTCSVVLCRLASRAFVVKRIGIDDGLALASLVSCPL